MRELIIEGQQREEALGLTVEERSYELAELMVNQGVEDEKMLEPGKMSRERVEEWRGAIKSLKVLRAQRRAEMATIQNECRALSMSMEMGPEELRSVLDKASVRERRHSKSVIEAPTQVDRALIPMLARVYSYVGEGDPMGPSQQSLSLTSTHMVQSGLVQAILEQCKSCRKEMISSLKTVVLSLATFFEQTGVDDHMPNKLRQAIKRMER